MRAPLVLVPLLLILFGCGGTGTDAGAATGGNASGGKGAATGGVPATGGSSGDTNSGGSVAAGGTVASGGRATGGTSTTTGGANTGALVDCDMRKVLCKIATPSCPSGQVPSVNGTCYGPCTPIASCACATAAECPDNDQYTCWGRMHCGPYVD